LEDGFADYATGNGADRRDIPTWLLAWESAEDTKLAQDALAAVRLSDFAGRRTDTCPGASSAVSQSQSLLAQAPGVFPAR